MAVTFETMVLGLGQQVLHIVTYEQKSRTALTLLLFGCLETGIENKHVEHQLEL